MLPAGRDGHSIVTFTTSTRVSKKLLNLFRLTFLSGTGPSRHAYFIGYVAEKALLVLEQIWIGQVSCRHYLVDCAFFGTRIYCHEIRPLILLQVFNVAAALALRNCVVVDFFVAAIVIIRSVGNRIERQHLLHHSLSSQN